MIAIPGFDGYKITEEGRVFFMRNGESREARQSPSSNGYMRVNLKQGNRWRTKNIHSLVALAFIGPLPVGLEVRHVDGNHLNNNRSNLKYGTSRRNKLDTVAHGRHAGGGFRAGAAIGGAALNKAKTQCKRGHEFTPENTRVDRKGSRVCRSCESLRKRGMI